MTTFVIPENCPMSEDTLVRDPGYTCSPKLWSLRSLLDLLDTIRFDGAANEGLFTPKTIVRITSADDTMSWNFILPAK